MDRLRRLANAESVSDGLRVAIEGVPAWAAVAAGTGVVATYAVLFRSRLALARWRRRQRRKMEADYLLNASAEPQHQHSVTEGRQPRNVATSDIDAFASALGIVLPEDQDLYELVRQVFLDLPIPCEWELHCGARGLRFRNRNTEELVLFHPGVETQGEVIRSEVARRHPAVLAFAPAPSSADGIGTSSMTAPFSNLLEYFVRREKDRMQREVTLSMRGRDRSPQPRPTPPTPQQNTQQATPPRTVVPAATESPCKPVGKAPPPPPPPLPKLLPPQAAQPQKDTQQATPPRTDIPAATQSPSPCKPVGKAPPPPPPPPPKMPMAQAAQPPAAVGGKQALFDDIRTKNVALRHVTTSPSKQSPSPSPPKGAGNLVEELRAAQKKKMSAALQNKFGDGNRPGPGADESW